MFGQLSVVKNAFQSVICRGYSGVACLNAGVFILLIGPFPKTFIFFRNRFLNISISFIIMKINRLACN
jgi:hypothetical protein